LKHKGRRGDDSGGTTEMQGMLESTLLGGDEFSFACEDDNVSRQMKVWEHALGLAEEVVPW
jgi:hypothetical protein